MTANDGALGEQHLREFQDKERRIPTVLTTSQNLTEDRKALKTELGKLDISVKGKIGIGKTQPGAQIKDELDAFFNGTSANFSTPLAYGGSSFSQSVWNELRLIPAG